METIVLFLFMGLVFGGLYTLLAFGYQSIEVDRAKAEKQQVARQVPQEPRFFANMVESVPVEPPPLMPAHLIAQLEQRLRSEYEGAALFASQPSKDRICSGYGAYVDTVAGGLERHIRRESAATTAFAAKPSVEDLYVDSTRRYSFPEAPLR